VVSVRVTVVVAARDAAQTLGGTLASIQAQTFEEWDVVVVDDGSQDATADVVRAASGRIRLLHNETPQGPGAARNRAIREAAGALVATLDADDVWKPRYLESQVAAYERALASGRRVGVVCCDAELARDDGPTGGRWSDRVGRVEEIGIENLLEENVVFTSVLMPRSVFLAVGGYDENPALGVEDYDLWLRILEANWEIVMNPEVLAVYRLSADARSAKVARMAEGAALTLTKALARGALTKDQRRQARKRRRMFEAVRRRALVVAEPHPGRRALAAGRAAPLVLVSVLEHPERWRKWAVHGVRSAGSGRHEG
jgi:glycosyltransferase involved in cell wall biosynthesis